MCQCLFVWLFNDYQQQQFARDDFWNQFQYLGLPFISVLWLMVALLHTKTIYFLRNRMALLLFCACNHLFMRLTNPWHHLFYINWEARQLFGYYTLYMERGFWYYVNISYTILCLLLTIIIYFLGYLKNQSGHSNPTFWFLFCFLAPSHRDNAGSFAYEERSIDYSALIMPISCSLLVMVF